MSILRQILKYEMKVLAYIFLLFVMVSCQKQENTNFTGHTSNDDLWLIPIDEVLYLYGEKDRIQSIDNPEFIPINDSHLNPDDLVLVAHLDRTTKVYPVSVMDAHEIVNDNINEYYFSITYCPLTASGIIWNRTIDGEITEFGVSGMLYNDNLMPYDRNSESIWSQMEAKCVNGSLMGQVPESSALIETKFSTIKTAFPAAMVLDHSSCDSISCERSSYQKNDPLDGETVDLPFDQRYFGFVKDDNLMLFNLELFKQGTQVYTTNFQGSSLIVCGNKDLHFYTAFLKNKTSELVSYNAIQNEFPLIMKDDKGNKYDVFGKIVDGPEKGGNLKPANAYHARTFAWELFFKSIALFEN